MKANKQASNKQVIYRLPWVEVRKQEEGLGYFLRGGEGSQREESSRRSSGLSRS